jgi:ATP-dependent DNA helicase RecG
MTLFTMDVRDETGHLEVVFFNQPYLEQILQKGGKVILSGMMAYSSRKLMWQMKSPQYEVLDEEEEDLLHVGRIIPIYHETRGITSRHLRRIIKGLLSQYLIGLEEPLPLEIRQKHHLWTIQASVQEVHFPESSHPLESLNTWGTQAHRRLAFEECFLLQIALALRQRLNQGGETGIQFQDTQFLIDKLRGQLSYQLTAAQLRVIGDIRRDMMSPKTMNRLIQGDVGSGKTVVALHAMVMACGTGYQAVLMAPTEILAEQHYLSMKELLETLGLKIVLVKGGPSTKEKVGIRQQIKAGDFQVVIGTHALLQQQVEFAKLGIVVVDEQHKFGVLQRATLRDKGGQPDVLVMTATPIPRTLAMTAYGDLHVSVIDQLPPGRKAIQTLLFRRGERKRAYAQIREQISAGRQAYVVYPLVEESEKMDLEAAMQAAERLQTEEFPTYRVGLLHGRMKSEEKAQTMKTFKEKGIDILVATTVIEVGLDVPNATVMVIEHAERFGLAQLHQLRGRVGRGQEDSFCLLVSSAVRSSSAKEKAEGLGGQGPKSGVPSLPLPMESKPFPTLERPVPTATQSSQQRLQAMATCADGFAIAEEDLRIRGPGEFLGVRQSGTPEFRVVDLIRDGKILEEARHEAFALIERDPELTHPDHQVLKAAMLRRWQEKFDLGTVG